VSALEFLRLKVRTGITSRIPKMLKLSTMRLLYLFAAMWIPTCAAFAATSTGEDKSGDFVLVITEDIKQTTDKFQRIYNELRAAAKTEADRLELKRDAQRLYELRLDEVADRYWQKATLKRNQDWREVWSQRVAAALSEAKEKKLDAESLAKVFPKIREFDGGGDAQIPVRVLLAKFGDEQVWVVLVHWERAESVEAAVAKNDEVELSHVLVMAFRTTDLELVTLACCS